MIIPIGHDQVMLRRWPLVSFTIMGLCAAAFVVGALGPQPDREVVQERLDAVIQYYVEHPRLELDPSLARILEAAIDQQEPEVQEAIRERLSAPPDPPSPLDRDRQRRLDELTQDWRDALHVGQWYDLGLVPAAFRPDRLLTHLFVHAGLLHLLFNMLFLYFSGPSLEDVWGRPLFLFFYLAAGVASGAFYMAQYPDLAIPLVGASGAIAGLMGAFFVRFPRAELRLFYLWIGGAGTIEVPAWTALLVWAVGELFWAKLIDHLAPGTGGAGVAYWAHVSGFVFGVGFAFAMRALGIEERLEARVAGADPVWSQAERALRRENKTEAWQVLRQQVLRQPADDDAALAYWDLAHQLGRSREAAPVVLRLMRSELGRGDQEAALAHWDELKARVPDAAPAADLAVKLAACMLVRESRREAAELLRDALGRVDAATAPEVLAELATTAAGADRALGIEAASRALVHPGLPREARATLERLAAGDQSAADASAR